MKFLSSLLLFFCAPVWAHGGADFVTVTSTADAGEGSLRRAIALANDDSETQIAFQIPNTDAGYNKKTGVFTIQLRSPLPPVEAEGTVFDGLAQTLINDSNKSGPEIQISGSQAGKNAVGLQILAPECEVKGFILSGFGSHAVVLRGAAAKECRVQSNLITGNGGSGIKVENGAGGNWIGLAPKREKPVEDDFKGLYAKDQSNAIYRNGGDAIQLDAKSLKNELRGNRFGFNGGLPIRFLSATSPVPTLKIERDAEGAGHTLTVAFRGAANREIILDLHYFGAELPRGLSGDNSASSKAKIYESKTLKTDEKGVAKWKIAFPNYPVGSWAALATVEGATGPLSEIVVMPWLT